MLYTASSLIPKPGTVTGSPVGMSPLSAVNATILTLAATTELGAVFVTSLPNGYMVGVSLPGDEIQWWKLRALGVGEVAVADALVVALDPTRCWIRTG